MSTPKGIRVDDWPALLNELDLALLDEETERTTDDDYDAELSRKAKLRVIASAATLSAALGPWLVTLQAAQPLLQDIVSQYETVVANTPSEVEGRTDFWTQRAEAVRAALLPTPKEP